MRSEIKKYLSAIGAKGGSVTGPQKARTSEQARAAVNARWAKHAKQTANLTESKPVPVHSSIPAVGTHPAKEDTELVTILQGRLIPNPVPNRQGFWVYQVMPDNTLFEVELTPDKWRLLHAEVIAKEDARIQELNAHPLNKVALQVLKTGGMRPTWRQIHALSLAQTALPDFDTSEGYKAWMKMDIYTSNVAGMCRALDELEQELEPANLLDCTPQKAARLILSVFEVDVPDNTTQSQDVDEQRHLDQNEGTSP